MSVKSCDSSLVELIKSLSGLASTTVLDLVHADVVVTPSSEEVSSRLAPGEGFACKVLLGGALVGLHGGASDIVLDELVWWEVEDLDAGLGSNDEPVQLLGEENAVDCCVAVALCEPLSVDNVPDHDHAIAGSGCEVGGVLNDVEGGNLSLVSGEGVHEGHVEVVPHLDGLVPGGSDADSGLLGVVESDAGDGIGVLALVDGMLALRAGVPDLDLLVETSSDDLSVVSGEGDGEHILLMSDQLADGPSGGDVPESDAAIPGGREAEAGVSGKLDFTDEVRVA